MGVFYPSIPDSLMPWILAQKVLWVSTAPISQKGHINVSPKGGPYFGILSPTCFWYLDLTGSGVETLAHLLEPGNGRITVMFNAFEGPPRIVRLWGHGEVLEYGTKEYNHFVEEEGGSVEFVPGVRAVIKVHIHQVGSSCGFSMPFYDFKSYRTTLNDFFKKRVKNEEEGNHKDGIERYWAYKNALSIDGIPGMRRGVETAKRESVEPIKKMVGPLAPTNYSLTTLSKSSVTVPLWILVVVTVLAFCLGVHAVWLWNGEVSANFRNGRGYIRQGLSMIGNSRIEL